MKMETPTFLKQFMTSGRVGVYLRVLKEGQVGAADVVERVKVGPERMTVREMFHLLYFDSDNLEGARRALRIPAMSPGWRSSFEEIVAKVSEALSKSSDCCSGQ